MRINKVQFDGFLLSDLACTLEDMVNGSNSTEIEELVTCSDDLCPSNIDRCEYVALYWWQLRDHFIHADHEDLALAMDEMQREDGIERDTLIFCQV